MQFSFQRANPSKGGGSTLLRFDDDIDDRTACILVDSGDGVDLDTLLSPDDYLAAIVLTHAHLDHYLSIGDSLRDGAPIYTSSATASTLETVLGEGQKNYRLGEVADVLDAVTAINDWVTVTSELELRPISAGHVPGAACFAVRFSDGTETNTILLTGDFTARNAGGYSGLPTNLPMKVDALFVNASTNERFEATLSDSLETVLERVRAGSSVLVTTSGLTGVQYAYALGHLCDRIGEPAGITLTGQVAKLYDDLDYDVPNVESVPVFDRPETLFESSDIVVAGPEVPVEGSSKRLFECIENDPTATLVQLTGGAISPVESATCTVYDYEFRNHPTEETIDTVVERLNPTNVVPVHASRRRLKRYRGKYDSAFVWANDDTEEYILYEDGRWSAPPWLSDRAVRSIRAQEWQANGGSLFEDFNGDDSDTATLGRDQSVDLDAEGVEVERFDRQFDSQPVIQERTDAKPERAEEGETEPVETESASESADAEFRRNVLDRLDDIEASVSNSLVRARVVDAGDGMTLLRLFGDSDLEHGDEVELRVTDSE
ncbi:MBL fold metallo-hydrolase [Haladaptatus cibarius]|uniref:MBL fold metallo-hydrolase n=1 Tax=Haladaptatus cibarius TaxID=453847 RepID=UPI0006793A64|nr:MBL fold metallo-hydrolase [Haladaptatus cibarius]